MPFPEIGRGEVVGVEEQHYGRRAQRGGVRRGVAGRDVVGEDGAGAEVEGRQEGFGDADGDGGGGGRLVAQDAGREARGEDLDLRRRGGRGVEGGDELGVGVMMGGGRGG